MSDVLLAPEQAGLSLCAGAGKEAHMLPMDVLLLAGSCVMEEAPHDVRAAVWP